MTSPTTVLAIENDPADELALYQAALDGRRYQLSVAHSVAEARALLGTRTFDVVLTVDRLPDGSASDLVEQFSDQAVVFLGMAGEEETAARALQLGIENYLTKDSERRYLRLLPYRMEAAQRQSRRTRRLRESEARVRALDEAREDNDRFADLTTALPGAIFSFRLRRDGTTCFPYASPIIEKIFGVPPDVLVEDSTPLCARVHPDDVGPLRHSIAESARTMLPWSRRFRVCGAGGAETWVEGHATPVGEPDADITWHGVLTDVTLRTHEAMAREKLRTQMQHAQKLEAVSQLAAGVAHGFNNLLTIITGRAEWGLQQVCDGDPMRNTLRQIHDAGIQAAGLTQQLLSFSTNQGTAPIVLDLHRLIVSMQGRIKHIVGDQIGVTVLPAPSEGHVRADRAQIEQSIINLCVNARDAMPDGGTLTIAVRDVDIDAAMAEQYPHLAAGPHVELTVRDTGVGMDRAVRDRVFEPFFTTKPVGEASGLGLAVVYRTVRRGGGSVRFDTAPGKGTTFRVYLPRVAKGPEDVAAFDAGPDRDGYETILVVDDEVEVGNLARDILESAGYAVLTATSGEDALSLLERQERPVHLVLSDVTMRGMSGVALRAELAQVRPDVPVLLTSGFRDETMRRRDADDAPVPFLGKPYSATDLRRAVRGMLDGRDRHEPGGPGSGRPGAR